MTFQISCFLHISFTSIPFLVVIRYSLLLILLLFGFASNSFCCHRSLFLSLLDTHSPEVFDSLYLHFVSLSLVRSSDQSIIDRKGLLMQILLVVGLKIVLFTSKYTVTNFYECSRWTVHIDCSRILVHRLSADERLLLPTLVPRINLCLFTLSFSSKPFTGNAARGIIVSPYRKS